MSKSASLNLVALRAGIQGYVQEDIIARSIMGRSSARWRRNAASLSMPAPDTAFIRPGSIAVSGGRSGGLAPGVANWRVKAVIPPCAQPKSPRPFEHLGRDHHRKFAILLCEGLAYGIALIVMPAAGERKELSFEISKR